MFDGLFDFFTLAVVVALDLNANLDFAANLFSFFIA